MQLHAFPRRAWPRSTAHTRTIFCEHLHAVAVSARLALADKSHRRALADMCYRLALADMCYRRALALPLPYVSCCSMVPCYIDYRAPSEVFACTQDRRRCRCPTFTTHATHATDACNDARFKSLVVLGRRPKEVGGAVAAEVDVDLSLEGDARHVSRQQALVRFAV